MAKYEYPAGVLPDIEMYGGDTTMWKIPLRRPSGGSYATDSLEGYYCALTITPFSMAQNVTMEPVIIKNSEIEDDGMGGAMVVFEFEISDTINMSGKYVYQIELYSEEQSRVAQGYLYIKKNNNPYRINLEYSENTGTAGSGSSIVGGFRTPVRGVDYWTDQDKHEIIAAVIVLLEDSIEDDTYGLVGAIASSPEVQALAPVRGTDYWTSQDKDEIIDDVVETVTPTIQSLAPVRGTDYWTNSDQTSIRNEVISAMRPDISALANELIADATDTLSQNVNDAVVNAAAGLVATVSNNTLVITANAQSGGGT